MSCEEVGVVKRVHTLLGGVHRLVTALKVVEEVREEMQEIKDECEDEEVEGNGGVKVEEKRSSHAWMIWHAQHPWAMRCNVWIMTTRTWLTNRRTSHSRVSVHVRCVEGVLGLGGHVVTGVVLGFTTQTQYQIQMSFLLDFVVHLCTGNQTVFCDRQFLSVANYCTSRKWVIWGVVFTHPVGYSRPPSAVTDFHDKNSKFSACWDSFRK